MKHPLSLSDNQIGCSSKNGHSQKECWCGGHNMTNVSRNLNHHGTKAKLFIRKSKLASKKLKEAVTSS